MDDKQQLLMSLAIHIIEERLEKFPIGKFNQLVSEDCELGIPILTDEKYSFFDMVIKARTQRGLIWMYKEYARGRRVDDMVLCVYKKQVGSLSQGVEIVPCVEWFDCYSKTYWQDARNFQVKHGLPAKELVKG